MKGMVVMSGKSRPSIGSHATHQQGLSRRHMLGLAGAALTAGTVGLGTIGLGTGRARAAGTGQLNIYSWPDYFSKESLAAYAKQSGVTPNISTYDSNETMFAKLKSPAGAGFAIII